MEDIEKLRICEEWIYAEGIDPESLYDEHSKPESKRSDLSAPMVGKYPRLMGNV